MEERKNEELIEAINEWKKCMTQCTKAAKKVEMIIDETYEYDKKYFGIYNRGKNAAKNRLIFKDNFATLFDMKGCTIEEAALGINVSKNTIKQWLYKPEPGVSWENLQRISDFFGVSAKTIVESKIAEESNTKRSTIRRSVSDRRYMAWPVNMLNDIYDTYSKIPPNDILERCNKALNVLNERERSYIIQYYKDGKTYQAIGLQENISRERVRQIIAKAIRTLRRTPAKQYLEYSEAEIIELQELDKRKYESLKEKMNTPILKIDDETSFDDLRLSIRAQHALLRGGYSSIADVEKLLLEDGQELKKIRGIGPACYNEIIDKMKSYTGFDYRELVRLHEKLRGEFIQ